MFISMWIASKAYDDIPLKRVIVLSVILTGIGVLGAKTMAFIETGDWSGRSFFGAVFLVPVVMFIVAKLGHMEYGHVIDICAPAGCAMQALLKVKCKIDGCCFGRFVKIGNTQMRFPSQIVECIAAILLMLILYFIIYSRRWKGMVYAWYMVLYGIIRFILNLYRETKPWIGPLPQGNFWSIISLLCGFSAFIYYYRKKRKTA